MKKLFKITAVTTAAMMLFTVGAGATRRRYTGGEIETTQEEEKTEMDYGNIYFFEMPSTGEDESLFDKFNKQNGTNISIPDYSDYTVFEEDDITDFSDAIVDYLGWKFNLGQLNYDLSSKTMILNSGIVGYKTKKFGDGDIRFKAKTPEGAGGFISVTIRASNLSTWQWNGNDGYLIIIKDDRIELQKYFPEYEMAQEILDITPLRRGEWQEFSVNSYAENGGTRIIVTIDGTEYVNWLDNGSIQPPEQGYVNIGISTMKDVEILPATEPSIAQKATLGENAVDVDNVIAFKTNASNYFFDGEYHPFDANQSAVKPIEINGTQLVPVRLAEKLGAWIEWNAEYRNVSLAYGENSYILSPGFAEISVNGIHSAIKSAPVMQYDRMYIPVSVLCDYLGCKQAEENGVTYLYYGDREAPSAEERQFISQGF